MAAAKSKKIRRYMLVDGNAIVHRGFHAIPNLSTKSGEPTNAVYGFTMILLRALTDIKPDYAAVAFDLPKPTFRHEAYKEYKATRVKAPDELYAQIPRCKEIVRALGIHVFEKEGFEADDVLGTMAKLIEKENVGKDDFETLIVTGDLDTLQLVTEHTKVYTMRKGITDIAVYDPKAVRERYGINPDQVVDFKSIKGDASDNIPGVTGIGEKGASELIQNFGSLENIYKNLDKLKPKQKDMFETQKEQAEMSYKLSEINCDVPLEPNLSHVHFSEVNYMETVRLFQELEFKSLISKLPKNGTGPNASEGSKRDVVVDAGSKTLSGGMEHNEERAESAKKTSNTKQDYTLVETEAQLNKLVAELAKQKEFAFDTETDGLGAFDFDLVGVGFAYEEGIAWYIPATLLKSANIEKLKKVFADEKIGKIAHNIKYDYAAMQHFGVEVKNLAFDTMIASYLLSPGSRTHNLDTSVFNEFGYQMQPIEELIGKGKTQAIMSSVDPKKVSFYCCEDTDFTLRLKNVFAPRLESEGLEKIFRELEMPLVTVLAAMEENGVLLDKKLFGRLEVDAAGKITALEKAIYKDAGHEFNINSPTQMKVVLFDELKLTPDEGVVRKRTKTGLSTAAGELEKLRKTHPIVKNILEYRELAKLQSTYIKALPDLVSKRDGRLHTSFNQTIAATGRLSSSNPNLQNIPVGSDGIASEIRKGFIAGKGDTLLAIDYSQIELRVVAHLSGDPTMKKVFQNGEDIHTATAMEINGLKDPKLVTKEMRRDAKTINFGLLYGLSAFGLSERIESLNRAEAAAFIRRYFEAFPKVDAFMAEVAAETHRNGFVKNELGRKRYMPEINSSQHMVRAAAERAAINMPVQSLEADIMKIAMNNISDRFDIRSEEFKMLLQVHDELVFEVRDDRVDFYAKEVHAIMESAYKLSVPLIAEIKTGQNWGEMVEREAK
jgi:DNA polymerase-1